jgi:ABC-2 type transport system ATP-binding protein
MSSSLAIETLDLTRTFGSRLAVDRLDLRVPCGTIYGFLGPNGAGKTTTIRMLLGLMHPSDGRMLINGEPFTRDLVTRQKLKRSACQPASPTDDRIRLDAVGGSDQVDQGGA